MINRILFSNEQLPAKARWYILTLIGLGLPLFLYCLHGTVTQSKPTWIILALLTILVTWFPFRIFAIKEHIWLTLADVFVFGAMFYFGALTAAVLAGLEAATFNFRTKTKRIYRSLFNVCQIVIVAFCVGNLLNFMQASDWTVPELAIPIIGIFCGAIYYILNTLTLMVAITLSSRESFHIIWSKNMKWLSLPVVEAFVAAAIFLFMRGTIPIY